MVTGSSAKKSLEGDLAGGFGGGGIPVMPAWFDWLEDGGVRLLTDILDGGSDGRD
jgi:hypothetical protein